ncbi:unnamed protein product [Closterium sp. Yama58-4]|nr:unnamed protein product [Closterium sp. Yama58-4]
MAALSAQLSRSAAPSLKSDLLRHEPVIGKRAVTAAPSRRRFARSSPALVATVAQSSQPSPTSLRDQADANAAAAIVTSVGPSDTFVQSLVAKYSLPAPSDAAFSAAAALGQLRNVSAEAARVLRWPGRKDEEFRFTDLKSLRAILDKALEGAATGSESQVVSADVLAEYTLEEAKNSRLVVLDGAIRPELSDLTGIPAQMTVKLLSELNADEVERFVSPNLGRFAAQADLFAALNGASAADVLVIAVPANVKLPNHPIHIVYASSSASPAPASPRLLVVAEAGAEVEVVEEFVGGVSAGGGKGEWVNAVAEIVIGAEGSVSHAVIQNQPAKDCFNIKRTFVAQEESSKYSLVEAQLGAAHISRHNLKMQQLGEKTETHVDTFALAGGRQVQDLHSSLVLDFPGGVTRQLHKCIVSDATGQCVFDGNVKVNKLAQQTDAGQLSRSLLLVPRGTINVKPNLQIIADDVKCTHGAAISDLDDEQLFYFRTRGIDQMTARSALVFSFAAEVVDKLPYKGLRRRVEETVKKALSAQGAMEASVAADLQGATS